MIDVEYGAALVKLNFKSKDQLYVIIVMQSHS